MLVGTLLAVAGMAVSEHAQSKKAVTTIRVTVSVTDSQGKPVQNAGVVMRQMRDEHNRIPHDPFHVEIHTDEYGKAAVQGFEPGVVLVQVLATNYQTWGQAFILSKPNESVYIKLKPPQAQVSTFGKGKPVGCCR